MPGPAHADRQFCVPEVASPRANSDALEDVRINVFYLEFAASLLRRVVVSERAAILHDEHLRFEVDCVR